MPQEKKPFELPSDLTSLTAEDLAALESQARAEFKAIQDAKQSGQPYEMADAERIADGIKQIVADRNRRAEESAAIDAKFAELVSAVDTPATDPTTPVEPAAADPAAPVDPTATPAEPAAPAAAPEPVGAGAVTAAARPAGGAQTASRELGGLAGQNAPRINPSLTRAAGSAPTAVAPASKPLAITASFNAPGVDAGQTVKDLATLGELYEARAKSLPDVASGQRGVASPSRRAYGGAPVARITHEFDRVFDLTSPRDTIAEYADSITKRLSGQQMEALVAAGGWCSPSEIRYDFFSVDCFDGAIDLPTFGVRRGGLRWPLGPTVNDAFTPDLGYFESAFGEATVPWVWTETRDVVAATGGAGLVTKPCIRVPCSTFDEARLECYGVCVTAGNLTDDAWPEQTQRFLRFMENVFQHAINGRYIAAVRSLSTDIGTVSCTGVGAISPLLDMLELSAWDMRERLGMCGTDVLEVILPRWIVGELRADLGRRMGLAEFNVTDAMIGTWFTVRGIRVQLVGNYQTRTTGLPGASSALTSWPSSVEFIIYPPGTFGRGNGMTLDLGVVRDSTLNATNDHTAAWYEQCHLIAKFGPLARRYTVPLCPSGVTGAANITSCCA
jgi:hypothetical protein